MQTLSALAWLAQHLHWGRRQKQCALLCDRGASIRPTCNLSTSTFAGRTRSFLNFEETSRLSRVKPSARSASDSRHISLGSGGRPFCGRSSTLHTLHLLSPNPLPSALLPVLWPVPPESTSPTPLPSCPDCCFVLHFFPSDDQLGLSSLFIILHCFL